VRETTGGGGGDEVFGRLRFKILAWRPARLTEAFYSSVQFLQSNARIVP
jgi:hypothetical protein